MALAAIAFFPRGGAGSLSDEALMEALAVAHRLAPPGSRCEVRALEETCLDIQVPPGGPPRFTLEGGPLPTPFARAAATIWFDNGLDNIELTAQQTAAHLHEALSGRGAGVFDVSDHIRPVAGSARAGLHVLATMTRRLDIDRDDFIQYYRTTHVTRAKAAQPIFSRYTTFRLLESVGDLPIDCVTLLDYAARDALRKSLAPPPKSDRDPPPSDLPRFVSRIVYNIGERLFT